MNNLKCPGCGLVNFASDAACRRCGIGLDPHARQIHNHVAPHEDCSPPIDGDAPPKRGHRSLLTRISGAIVVAFLIVVVLHTSLLLTSQRITPEQRAIVMRAVRVLEERGFESEAWRLRHLASFRSNDNWWNAYVGHADAYAATNFPFQVVTLYPDFFVVPADDTERAAVLLHEAQHMTGANEPRAFAEVWVNITRLGWTEETHGSTRVWRGTRELTREYAPHLFADATPNEAAPRAD